MAQDFPIGPVDAFSPGKFVVTTINDIQIGVVRLGAEKFRAVRNWCPHKGAPICRGIVGGTWPPSAPGELVYDHVGQVLVCPWHGFEYDLDTGRELFQAVPTRLRLYPVTVRDNHVYVTV